MELIKVKVSKKYTFLADFNILRCEVTAELEGEEIQQFLRYMEGATLREVEKVTKKKYEFKSFCSQELSANRKTYSFFIDQEIDEEGKIDVRQLNEVVEQRLKHEIDKLREFINYYRIRQNRERNTYYI